MTASTDFATSAITATPFRYTAKIFSVGGAADVAAIPCNALILLGIHPQAAPVNKKRFLMFLAHQYRVSEVPGMQRSETARDKLKQAETSLSYIQWYCGIAAQGLSVTRA